MFCEHNGIEGKQRNILQKQKKGKDLPTPTRGELLKAV